MKAIFIIGITGRSGTHYLKQLLKIHPEISLNVLNREDHFISELNYLEKYVNPVTYWWKRNDREHEKQIKNKLMLGIGNGILSFVSKEPNKKYFLLNTPYTNNINLFDDYFLGNKIIIILRDAKDTVESGVRSKFWTYEEGFELWNRSAKRILDFKETSKNKVLILKYEDIFIDTQSKLKEVFDYLELSDENYPYEKTEKTVIQGSSDAKKDNNWEYKNIQKTENFNPLSRSQNWGILRKWRFEWKCGKNSEKLGYNREQINIKFIFYVLNIIFDFILFPSRLKLKIKDIIIKQRAKKNEI